jgi:hypothetical protein
MREGSLNASANVLLLEWLVMLHKLLCVLVLCVMCCVLLSNCIAQPLRTYPCIGLPTL